MESTKKKKEYINRVLAEGYFKLSITITIIQFFKDLICYNKFNLYIKPLSWLKRMINQTLVTVYFKLASQKCLSLNLKNTVVYIEVLFAQVFLKKCTCTQYLKYNCFIVQLIKAFLCVLHILIRFNSLLYYLLSLYDYC